MAPSFPLPLIYPSSSAASPTYPSPPCPVLSFSVCFSLSLSSLAGEGSLVPREFQGRCSSNLDCEEFRRNWSRRDLGSIPAWMKFEGSSVAAAARRSRLCRDAICDVERVIRKKKATAGGGGATDYHRRPRRRVEAASTAIQTLFLACKSIFKGSGTVPSAAEVRMLRCLLDNMTSEDVDLSADIPFFKAKSTVEGAPGVSYTTIYQGKNFSICIFFLRPAAVIPLHDHPGMTVFSKLLLGSMHVRSFDFVDPPHPAAAGAPPVEGQRRRRLAKLTVEADLTAPCGTSVLFPEGGGNIHAFTAITPCAVLDILGPPYSAEDDRDITYYKDHPFSDGAAAGEVGGEEGEEALYRWLEETDVPEEAAMAPVTYLGPPIIDV